jgi:DNA primase
VARIPQDTIDRIRDTADIVDVVSHHVDLTKRGRNFFGLCPFHNEKTPSFSVAPDKGIYHCFGCGNGGSALNFIMEIEKISFVDAVIQLGKQLGIEIEFSGSDDSKEFFGKLYEIHELATEIFHKTLFSDQGRKAKEYLLKRGLNEASLKLFKVGFVPEQPSYLFNSIKSKNYDRETMEKSGLFGFSNSKIYDRFRSRIMFPISNNRGRVIAFGGRVFAKDDPAKYMNSPETPLYKKSDIFYGLDITRDAIRRKESAILVEGYTDLIQLYQAGVKNVVAVSGTAFTKKHVNQIRRFTSKVYLCYDGDLAGINAAKKAGYSLLKEGIDSKVIVIPDGLDPDDWINRDGKEIFVSNGINKSLELLKFHLRSSNYSKSSAPEKVKIEDEILKEVSEIQEPLIRHDFIKKLALVGGIEENEVLQKLTRLQMKKRKSSYSEEQQKSEDSMYSSTHEKAELGIIKVLVSNDEDARSLIKENLKVNQIKNPKLNKLVNILLKVKEVNPVEIISSFNSSEERELISKTLMDEDETSSFVQMAEDCLKTLKKIATKDKIDQMRIKIREMEAKDQDTTDLMKEIVEIQKKLHA